MMLVASTSTGTTSVALPNAQLSCTTCLVNFNSKEAKRIHMRDDEWHVYNLRRRVASLCPISLESFQKSILPSRNIEEPRSSQRDEWGFYQTHKLIRRHSNYPTQIQSNAKIASRASFESDDSSSSHNHNNSSSPETFNPQQCLFCPEASDTLSNSLNHMSRTHSFFVPNASHLVDTVSFLSYLFLLISDFHECLFCGVVKGSKAAVWDHMRGKGHCRLGVLAEQEMGDFWDFSDNGDLYGEEEDDEGMEEEMIIIPNEDEELRLPSGKILGHRSHRRNFRQASSAHTRISSSPKSVSSLRLLTEQTSNSSRTIPASGSDRRIATRASVTSSMIGVPELQLRALMATEQKIEKLEMRARNEYQSKLERGGNKQKRFRVLTMGKKAGGLEKRLG